MKSSSFMTGLALALSVSVAGVASAQSTQRADRGMATQSDSGFRRGPGRGGRGGPEGMLLRGITLSDKQKARVEQLRAESRKEFEKNGGRARAGAAQGQKLDASARAARRAEMEKVRDQRIASLRSILDSQQRAQFDKNVAEMKAHGPRQGRDGAERRNGAEHADKDGRQ